MTFEERSNRDRSKMSRREACKWIAAGGFTAVMSGCISQSGSDENVGRGARRAIRSENEKPGTRDWMLGKTGIDPKTKYRCPWIEGYCSHTSIRAGETLRFFVSTNPSSAFRIDVYRLGFYGGAGGRQVASLGPFKGTVQPDPPVGEMRVRECQWEPSAELRISREWLSGVYVGKLTAEREGWQSYVIFIVRDDRRADFIFQCSDTTWQSYNRWPSQFSLYDDGKNVWHCGPGSAVSFDRPYGKYCQILDAPLSTGSGEFFLWEFPFAYWLEANGYDVTYISNLDTHQEASSLNRARGLLSVGHDEYYTLEMYHHLRGAIDRGLSVGFFSGNTCCGRIALRASRDGRANRVFTRADYFGPRDEGMIQRFPSMGAFPHTSPQESLLMGARNVPPCTGGADWNCSMPDHWLFAGTGMKEGDSIPGLVGWEFHGNPAKIPGLAIVSTGSTQDAPGKPNGGTYTATVYPGPKGNVVFNASSCWWGDGLSEPPGYVRPSVYTSPRGPDLRVQRITRNILERMRTVHG